MICNCQAKALYTWHLNTLQNSPKQHVPRANDTPVSLPAAPPSAQASDPIHTRPAPQPAVAIAQPPPPQQPRDRPQEAQEETPIPPQAAVPKTQAKKNKKLTKNGVKGGKKSILKTNKSSKSGKGKKSLSSAGVASKQRQTQQKLVKTKAQGSSSTRGSEATVATGSSGSSVASDQASRVVLERKERLNYLKHGGDESLVNVSGIGLDELNILNNGGKSSTNLDFNNISNVKSINRIEDQDVDQLNASITELTRRSYDPQLATSFVASPARDQRHASNPLSSPVTSAGLSNSVPDFLSPGQIQELLPLLKKLSTARSLQLEATSQGNFARAHELDSHVRETQGAVKDRLTRMQQTNLNNSVAKQTGLQTSLASKSGSAGSPGRRDSRGVSVSVSAAAQTTVSELDHNEAAKYKLELFQQDNERTNRGLDLILMALTNSQKIRREFPVREPQAWEKTAVIPFDPNDTYVSPGALATRPPNTRDVSC